MNEHPRPRYHNSPKLPKPPKKSWRLPQPYEDLLVQSWLCTLAIVTSPLWIPVLIVLLPSKWLFARFQKLRRSRIAASTKPLPLNRELERRRITARLKKEAALLRDPISDDPAYSWAIEEASRRAEEEIGGYNQLGDCHRIWRRKKQILKEEFGIDWFTPKEMNPGVIFD
jgi:hypothetical protein